MCEKNKELMSLFIDLCEVLSKYAFIKVKQVHISFVRWFKKCVDETAKTIK